MEPQGHLGLLLGRDPEGTLALIIAPEYAGQGRDGSVPFETAFRAGVGGPVLRLLPVSISTREGIYGTVVDDDGGDGVDTMTLKADYGWGRWWHPPSMNIDSDSYHRPLFGLPILRDR